MSTQYRSIPELLLDLVPKREVDFRSCDLLADVRKMFPDARVQQISAGLNKLRREGVVRVTSKGTTSMGGRFYYYRFTGDDAEWGFKQRQPGIKKARGAGRVTRSAPEPDVPRIDQPKADEIWPSARTKLVQSEERKETMKYRILFDVESTKLETLLSLLVEEVSNVRVAQSPCKDKSSVQPQQESMPTPASTSQSTVEPASWRPAGEKRYVYEEPQKKQPDLVVDLSDMPKYTRGSGKRPASQTRTGRIAIELAKRLGKMNQLIMSEAMVANGFKKNSGRGILSSLEKEGVMKRVSPRGFILA